MGPNELDNLRQTRRYAPKEGGTEGKYFFESPEQASNVARMQGDKPYTTTSVRVPASELRRGTPINPARKGPGYVFDIPSIPTSRSISSTTQYCHEA